MHETVQACVVVELVRDAKLRGRSPPAASALFTSSGRQSYAESRRIRRRMTPGDPPALPLEWLLLLFWLAELDNDARLLLR